MAEKVLIVDDDVQTLRLVGLMLERQGFRILSANSGNQALQMAHSEHPDAIVLDVMMPDLDGYEVSRRLRREADTTNIPILMFTARVQVEDKVSGYEAGADDYLTKPIHPAELTSHLRALLSRSKTRTVPPKEHGYTVGVLAAKGGLGVSTLALNLALAFHQRTKADVIAAEMRPGTGTWAVELASTAVEGLNNLLRLQPGEITAMTIEPELTELSYGIRLLQTSACAGDTELMRAAEQREAIVDCLPQLAKLVVLDLGTPYQPGFDSLLSHCNELIVVTEPFPASVQHTRLLIGELAAKGFGKTRLLSVVSLNRLRSDIQLSLMQMQEILGTQITQAIPPAPELAYQAAVRNVPLLFVQPSSPLSQQFTSLAERLAQRVLA
jgi:DNA-binding response OmpR family regulator